LIDKFGSNKVSVFRLTQEDFEDVQSTTDGDSFKEGKELKMSYKDFVEKMSKDDRAEYNMRD